MAKRKRPKLTGMKFEELGVGQYFCFGDVIDPARVFRKAGRNSAVRPDNGVCKVDLKQIVTPCEKPT